MTAPIPKNESKRLKVLWQYELLDTHITNSRLILNHPAKGMYNAVQIFKTKSPGSSIIAEDG